MHLNHLSYCFSIDNAHFRVSMLSDGVINYVIPGHSHAKGCYEIHCITDGNGSILLNNTRFPVAKGSIYVTGPHIFHEQTPDHAHPMAEMCVYMQLIASPDQHDDTLFDKHLVQSFLQQTCWIGTDTTGILPIMKQIFQKQLCLRLSVTKLTCLACLCSFFVFLFAAIRPIRIHLLCHSSKDK